MENKRPGLIKRSFLFVWRLLNNLRQLVLNLIFLLIFIVVLAGLFHEEGPAVPDASALILDPSGVLVDQISYADPFSNLFSGNDEPPETLLSDLVKAVDGATADPRIKLIVLQTDALEHAGISKTEELSAALQRFREHKKRVIAVGDSFNQDQYLLAAQADQILMNPMGEVLLQGFGVYTNYFKEALDKLQVSVHVFRVGAFKSAVEPFMRDDMSDEVKQNHLTWLSTLWQHYKAEVTTRRHIEPQKFDDYVNKIDEVFAAAQGDTGKAALDWHLIDALKTREQINDLLVEQVGADENGNFRGVTFREYLAASKHLRVGAHGDRVGVIVASGTILDGEQRPGQVGGDTLAALIRQAREDEDIKAVVLRIDSGGGSAFASEIIRQEILALQKAGKPFVVSMGSMAASGGYWIAADADEVWATPGTITGSIGIFGAFPTIEKTLGKLGVHTDGVGTTAMAGAMRIDRPLDAVTARAIQSNIDNGYRHFLQVVAAGRTLDIAAVDKIAQGRVWSGSDALGVGLVDKMGGLTDAIAAAAARAELKTYGTEWIEPPLSFPEVFLQKMSGALSELRPAGSVHWYGAAAIWSPLRPLLEQAQRFAQFNDPKAMYVYCVACAPL
jgi:protease-4